MQVRASRGRCTVHASILNKHTVVSDTQDRSTPVVTVGPGRQVSGTYSSKVMQTH